MKATIGFGECCAAVGRLRKNTRGATGSASADVYFCRVAWIDRHRVVVPALSVTVARRSYAEGPGCAAIDRPVDLSAARLIDIINGDRCADFVNCQVGAHD